LPLHRNLSILATSLIREGKLTLLPFFSRYMEMAPRFHLVDNAQFRMINLQSFSHTLISPPATLLIPPKKGLLVSSIKYYKYLSPATIVPEPVLEPTKWRQFWSLSIPLHSRTIWYRSLHGKLATKSTLHYYMPLVHTSPYCPHCPESSHSIETNDHFLFSCPVKLTVWRSIFTMYISGMSSESDEVFLQVLQNILSFNSSVIRISPVPLPEISVSQIFACTLLAIWQAHWRRIFDETPFIPDTVISKSIRHFSTLHSQFFID